MLASGAWTPLHPTNYQGPIRNTPCPSLPPLLRWQDSNPIKKMSRGTPCLSTYTHRLTPPGHSLAHFTFSFHAVPVPATCHIVALLYGLSTPLPQFFSFNQDQRVFLHQGYFTRNSLGISFQWLPTYRPPFSLCHCPDV